MAASSPETAGNGGTSSDDTAIWPPISHCVREARKSLPSWRSNLALLGRIRQHDCRPMCCAAFAPPLAVDDMGTRRHFRRSSNRPRNSPPAIIGCTKCPDSPFPPCNSVPAKFSTARCAVLTAQRHSRTGCRAKKKQVVAARDRGVRQYRRFGRRACQPASVAPFTANDPTGQTNLHRSAGRFRLQCQFTVFRLS